MLNSLLDNGGEVDLSATDKYTAILGATPSYGARSPLLWNAVFVELGISARMYPMDVNADKLAAVIRLLRQDERFIGGSVAVPYKSTIMSHLDEIEEEAKIIGAVNCIYRCGEHLIGGNTDGEGAVRSLQFVLNGRS